MDPTAPELSRIVEYRRDRWNMARVPLALLFCLTGLFFVVYVDPRPPGLGILKGFALLMVAAAIVALAVFAFERKFEGRVVAAGLLATVLGILALAVLCWIAPADFFPTRRGSKLPANWFGWSLITGSLVYVTWALYRHFMPARPMLLLSPAGIAFVPGKTASPRRPRIAALHRRQRRPHRGYRFHRRPPACHEDRGGGAAPRKRRTHPCRRAESS